MDKIISYKCYVNHDRGLHESSGTIEIEDFIALLLNQEGIEKQIKTLSSIFRIWLRDYLKTKATTEDLYEILAYTSKFDKIGYDWKLE